eukprot:5570446-Pleurochrysis_carterae.AAC.1
MSMLRIDSVRRINKRKDIKETCPNTSGKLAINNQKLQVIPHFRSHSALFAIQLRSVRKGESTERAITIKGIRTSGLGTDSNPDTAEAVGG